MIFSKGQVENQEFWNKTDIPTFDQEDFQNFQVLMGNFTKVGKTFKQRCVRTYFLVKQFLLYSDVGKGNRIKGFVQLDTVYCQFNEFEQGLQISLINNGYQIHLYTEDKKQFNIWVEALSNCCILSDFDKTYKLGAQIGQGSFSTVHQCQNKEGEIFAVKIIKKQTIKQINKNKYYEEQLLNEIQALRMFNHPNILKLYRVYENQSNIYLLTEHIDGPELVSQQSSKKIYQQEDLRIMIFNILSAIEQIHQQKVMHRDIKPQNILLNGNDIQRPVIIDFGLAAFTWQKSIPFPQCGSPGYSAPEVLKYEESKKTYNQQCDIFSIGITLFVVLYGYNPFKQNDLKQTIKKNTEAYFEIPASKYPKTLENLICQMTKKYPKDRITISEALNHQFFQTPFFCQISLPKQIVSKQYHDINAKGETHIHMHASMEMDQGINYVSQANTQTTPQNLGNKVRTISILSVPISRKSQEYLKQQEISSFSRASNEKEQNQFDKYGIRLPSKTLPQQKNQQYDFEDEYELNNYEHDNNFVDQEHLHKLNFSINSKLFQTSKLNIHKNDNCL
ncbi:unnamed protein product [Paramecium sonneborni]|uniref:non-specific serine/threonine protein kinase n=1 Tax=Paramecium sonneborni TaxID=65129 RepID=A0A8S1KLC0_9CILI|nr:unnamed protein product [Paramecium sonneborni]